MKKILVTGGAGFIGSCVCRYLVCDLGIAVVNVDALTYAANQSSLASVQNNSLYSFIHGNICDSVLINSIFTEHTPDAVIHLAAESHVDKSITGAAEFINTNIIGTFSMLEAARRYCSDLSNAHLQKFRFLHVSTDEVFGSLGEDGLFTETTPYAPRSPYSASKAASDHLVNAWHETYGLNTLISNCSNNYGPYHLPEKLIPLMVLNALEGRDLPVYGDGTNIRDWLYVEDHAKALVSILQSGRVGETYNIGGRNERSNLQVVHTLCDILDAHAKPLANGKSRRSLIKFVQDRPGHDKRYAIDATKLETELGWRAEENFETGLTKTVLWYLNNESWWLPLRELAQKRQGLN